MSELSDELKGLMRRAILMRLRDARPYALKLPFLRLGLEDAGLRVSKEDVIREAELLKDDGLIARVEDRLAPGMVQYKLLPEGLRYLEREGL